MPMLDERCLLVAVLFTKLINIALVYLLRIWVQFPVTLRVQVIHAELGKAALSRRTNLPPGLLGKVLKVGRQPAACRIGWQPALLVQRQWVAVCVHSPGR